MQNPIKQFYLFCFFNSIALAVVANFVFIDKIFLRMGFSMTQFGMIKGFAWCIPSIINWLMAPAIMRAGNDRKIISIAYFVRVILPYFLILLPFVTENKTVMVFFSMLILVASIIFPTIANNSFSVLWKIHIPSAELGRYTSLIQVIWAVPGYLISILCGWYMDRYSGAGDPVFYSALLRIFLWTTVFQIAASWIIMRLPNEKKEDHSLPQTDYIQIFEPFKNGNFRIFLYSFFLVSTASAMVGCFINPYLMIVRGMNLSQINLLIGLSACAGFVLLPFWGRLADRFGGKNIYRFCLIGVSVGLFLLTSGGLVFFFIFLAFVGIANSGIFSSGLFISGDYLRLALTRKEKSNIYLAASTLAGGSGILAGSLFGGFLLDGLKEIFPYNCYSVYFAFCGVCFLAVARFVNLLKDGRDKISMAGLVLRIAIASKSRLLEAKK